MTYWFGFVSDLRTSALKEGILIEDSFPSEDQIILMNPAYDIHDKIPSYVAGCVENINGHMNRSDISVQKGEEVNHPQELNNSDELTSAISNITHSIEFATIE